MLSCNDRPCRQPEKMCLLNKSKETFPYPYRTRTVPEKYSFEVEESRRFCKSVDLYLFTCILSLTRPCLSVSIVCIPIRLSIFVVVLYLPALVCLSVLPACLPVCCSIYLSIYLSNNRIDVYLSVCMPVCMYASCKSGINLHWKVIFRQMSLVIVQVSACILLRE